MIKEKLWKYHHLNEDNVEFIADELNTSKTVAKVLTSSGFNPDSKNELDRFLSPKIDEILTFEGLSSHDQLEASYKRMQKAKKKNEKIMVNGDPDADGISGTTIITTGLRQLGFEVDYAFPIRSREGHGLQIRIIQEAKEKGISLIITTDCGTKDIEAVEYANENGIDVIY